MTLLCPCDSGLSYAECCEPYITGIKDAPTAEALMRSRYTAYVVHAIDYIINTCLEKNKMNPEGIKDWSEKSTWLGFKILSLSNDDEEGDRAKIVFESIYERKSLKYVHHETATFKKQDNRWFYDDGEILPQTIARAGPKTGRNDPCPCGSGKKYKLCCGR